MNPNAETLHVQVRLVADGVPDFKSGRRSSLQQYQMFNALQCPIRFCSSSSNMRFAGTLTGLQDLMVHGCRLLLIAFAWLACKIDLFQAALEAQPGQVQPRTQPPYPQVLIWPPPGHHLKLLVYTKFQTSLSGWLMPLFSCSAYTLSAEVYGSLSSQPESAVWAVA